MFACFGMSLRVYTRDRIINTKKGTHTISSPIWRRSSTLAVLLWWMFAVAAAAAAEEELVV